MRVLVSVTILFLVAAAHAADWPQFLGPARDSRSPETGLLDTFGAKGPKVLWQHDVGEGFSSPVVAGDKVILFHRLGNEEVVECLDAAKGTPVWKFPYPTAYRDGFGKGNGPRATPTVAGKQVFTYGAEGKLHCLDLEKGTRVWERDLAKDYEPRPSFFGIGMSPIVEGDLVLVNVGGRDAGIVAMHRDTGKEAWKATSHEASYASPVAATIDGVRHVFFFTREGLVSLDLKKGDVRFSKRWRARINASVNATSPVVVGNEVFVTASYNTGGLLAKVKANGIDEVWSNDSSLSSHFSNCVAHDGLLFGFDGRQEEGGKLRCIDWKTGAVQWTKDGLGCGTLLFADGKLFVLSEEGELVLIEAAKTYREKARARVLSAGPCRAHLALSKRPALWARQQDAGVLGGEEGEVIAPRWASVGREAHDSSHPSWGSRPTLAKAPLRVAHRR